MKVKKIIMGNTSTVVYCGNKLKVTNILTGSVLNTSSLKRTSYIINTVK